MVDKPSIYSHNFCDFCWSKGGSGVCVLVTPTIFEIFEGVNTEQRFTSAVFLLLASLLFLLEGGSLFERLRCQLNGGDLTRPGALLVLSCQSPSQS